MNIQRLLIISGFISLLACVNPVIETDSKNYEAIGGFSTTYYPSTTSSSSSNLNETHEDFWDCGTDYITAKDPDGNLIITIIKIPCDPLQDIYLGCPSPIQ